MTIPPLGDSKHAVYTLLTYIRIANLERLIPAQRSNPLIFRNVAANCAIPGRMRRPLSPGVLYLARL